MFEIFRMNRARKFISAWKRVSLNNKIITLGSIVIVVCTGVTTRFYYTQTRVMSSQLIQMQSATRSWVGIVNGSRSSKLRAKRFPNDTLKEHYGYQLDWEDTISNFGSYPAQDIRVYEISAWAAPSYGTEIGFVGASLPNPQIFGKLDSAYRAWKYGAILDTITVSDGSVYREDKFGTRKPIDGITLFPGESFPLELIEGAGHRSTGIMISGQAWKCLYNSYGLQRLGGIDFKTLTRIDYKDHLLVRRHFIMLRVSRVSFEILKVAKGTLVSGRYYSQDDYCMGGRVHGVWLMSVSSFIK